jgi:hypothetical protein
MVFLCALKRKAHRWTAEATNCPVIDCADEKIAIEVDGPHHFTANTLAVTGEMLARQKLLKARGWAVISVPFFRWSGLSDAARTEWFFPVRPPPPTLLLHDTQACSAHNMAVWVIIMLARHLHCPAQK